MIDQTSKAVTSKGSVFAVLDSAPMTPAHYLYWLAASRGTLLDGFCRRIPRHRLAAPRQPSQTEPSMPILT